MKKAHSLSLVLIGNELLSGDINDTNGRYLLQKIRGTSLKADEIIMIKDDFETIGRVVKEQLAKHNLVVCSGGLGPTSDDMTVAAIAHAFGLPLEEDQESLSRLKKKYESRGRPLNTNSFKQTLFPKGSLVIPNEVGTADACLLSIKAEDQETHALVCLPGVPKEFQAFIEGELWTWIKDNLGVEKRESLVHFRSFGLSESHVASIIDNEKLIPENVEIAYRPQFPELLISLKSHELSEPELNEIREKVTNRLGKDYILTFEKDKKLPEILSEHLNNLKLTIAIAESCTGGRVSSELTKIAGSSKYFVGGIVSYSNEMKINILEVPTGLLARVGAVSAECAEYMAEGVLHKTGADYSISITGIAGPSGGSTDKPVGTIFIGVSGPEKRTAIKFSLPWERERNQIYASWLAIDALRRSILGLPLEWPNT